MGWFGEVWPLVAALTSMALLGTVAAVVVLVRASRTLRVENARWRRLARERADRSAMLSHELRTPLSLISGSAEVLGDGHLGQLSVRQRSLVTTIEVNAHTMATLTEDILASARIDSQMFTMRTSVVNVRTLVRDVLRDLAGLHRNELLLECRGYPPHLLGDPQLLSQAVINLVTNSVRHGGDGPVRVAVRRTEDSVLIAVSDTGSGMTAEQRKDVFRRTLRGKSETGHGLGMIITQQIVELHGGHLFIDSVENLGTTVTAQLPLRAASLNP